MGKEKLPSEGFNLRSVFLSAAIGIFALFFFMLIGAILLYREVIPADWLGLCAYIGLAIGGLLCGIFSFHSKKRLVSTICSAGILFSILFLIGIFSNTIIFSAFSFILVLIILLISAIIGMVLSTLFR